MKYRQTETPPLAPPRRRSVTHRFEKNRRLPSQEGARGRRRPNPLVGPLQHVQFTMTVQVA
jgi:hypothetical protein